MSDLHLGRPSDRVNMLTPRPGSSVTSSRPCASTTSTRWSCPGRVRPGGAAAGRRRALRRRAAPARRPRSTHGDDLREPRPARRLGVGAGLIGRAGIHLRTQPSACGTPVLLADDHGDVAFYGWPLSRTGPGQNRVRCREGGARGRPRRRHGPGARRPRHARAGHPLLWLLGTPSSPAGRPATASGTSPWRGGRRTRRGLRRRRLHRAGPSARQPDHHRARALLRLPAAVLLLGGRPPQEHVAGGPGAGGLRGRGARRLSRSPGSSPVSGGTWKTCSPIRGWRATRRRGSRRPSPTRSAPPSPWPG